MMSPLRRFPATLAALVAVQLAAQLAAQTNATADLPAAMIREGQQNSRVMQFQDTLCHDYGSRLTGSLAFDRAAAWALEQFKAMGLDARLEPWGEWQTGWDREQWMGRMLEPAAFELQVACPAFTGSTRGIARGTLLAMPADTAALDRLATRIDQLPDGVWLFGPIPKAELGDAVRQLLDRDNVHGIVQSATSTGWNDKRYPNQIRVFGDRNGGLRPYDERPRWAHAVVRDDQCAQLAQALAGEEPVVVEFELRNRFRRGPIRLDNVVADLVGSEFPDEVVIVCAHLDSWHQATGATDNGTGTCTTLETARILTKLGYKPKRTIRFMLWGGEEQGLLGSRQYVVQNRTRMHKVSAVFNHDSGTNWAHSLRIAESHRSDFEAIIQPILAGMQVPQAGHDGPVFKLDAVEVMEPAGGGSDHASFATVGVPAFSWSLTGEVPYGRGWHSQWDTFSIVVPEYQRHNATVFAVVAAGVADLDHMLSRQGVERATPGGRRRVDAQLVVEAWLGIELKQLTVDAIAEDSVAAMAGLKPGDVMRAVGEQAVANAQDLLAAVRAAARDRNAATITVVRNGQPTEVELRF